jgi:hypothetical protein
VTFGNQLIDNAYARLSRRVLAHQAPDTFESLLVGFKDDDAILDTSEKIATIRQADFSAKGGRKNHPAIIRHLYVRFYHVLAFDNANE